MQNNSNKNWENKGWEAMQQMLEKELPAEEKKPKRRAFFWYWAVAGIAVLLGAFFVNLYQSNSNLIVDEKSMPIADIFHVDSDDVFEEEKDLKENNDSQIVDNQGFTELKNNSNIERKNLNQKKYTQSKTSKKAEIIKNESIVGIQFETPFSDKTTLPEMAVRATGISDVFSKKTDENEAIIQNKKLTIFPTLPRLFADLNLSKIELSEAPKPNSRKVKRVERRKKKTKPVFGLSAGITSNIVLSANGIQVGGFVDFPIKSSKFVLQTGINYRLTRQREIRQNWNWGSQHNGNPEGLQNDTDDNLTIDTTAAVNEIASSTEYYYNNQKNQIESFQYSNYHTLSVPLGLKYKLHPKWDVLLGTEVSMLLNFLKNNPSAQLNDRVSASADPAFESIATFKLRNFDFAGVAAVNFQPSKHWQFNLKYHHGNLIQKNSWQVDNRFLSAGGSFVF